MSEQNDLQQFVAHCGLYCGNCPWHIGQIADLARDLGKELRKSHFDKVVEFIAEYPHLAVYKKYSEFDDVLTALTKGRCERICREEKGQPWCEVRKCCREKEIDGCWECKEFEHCEKLVFLQHGHGDAHIKNLRILKKKGLDGFIAGRKYWYTEIRK